MQSIFDQGLAAGAHGAVYDKDASTCSLRKNAGNTFEVANKVVLMCEEGTGVQQRSTSYSAIRNSYNTEQDSTPPDADTMARGYVEGSPPACALAVLCNSAALY